MDRQERKALFEQVDIYPVTCQRLSAGRTDLEVVDGIIRGGARIVQLREKEISAREIYRLALELRKKTAEAGVLLIINNHVDIALAVDADGVHLGQDDLPVEAARKLAPELLIGASTHSVAEALQAWDEGADYINIGPIFPTRTKEGIHSFLGPEAIPEISSRVLLPFTVMGGIKAGNMDQVLQKGARRIAMVTEITAAPDIAETVGSLRKKIRGWSAV
ncbi:thiamine phosphate synthase [Desulforhabdus sp. TSK]|uniref:thiamine phosphate synthase n=1 Tax=Desulforhabdus sp. TSK TaxID=2925014 RepID=UPI001FC8D545|nr:thiamine phosphate synthase [Desulforhabdus sp. TSK]GKT08672.1 thiamine-phosphate synthase [Desulforhabdus sp. TSK]